MTGRAASSLKSGEYVLYSLPIDRPFRSKDPKGSAVRKVGGTPRLSQRRGRAGHAVMEFSQWRIRRAVSMLS